MFFPRDGRSFDPSSMPPPPPLSPPMSSLQPCKFWVHGVCKFGKKCKFSHTLAAVSHLPYFDRHHLVEDPQKGFHHIEGVIKGGMVWAHPHGQFHDESLGSRFTKGEAGGGIKKGATPPDHSLLHGVAQDSQKTNNNIPLNNKGTVMGYDHDQPHHEGNRWNHPQTDSADGIDSRMMTDWHVIHCGGNPHKVGNGEVKNKTVALMPDGCVFHGGVNPEKARNNEGKKVMMPKRDDDFYGVGHLQRAHDDGNGKEMISGRHDRLQDHVGKPQDRGDGIGVILHCKGGFAGMVSGDKDESADRVGSQTLCISLEEKKLQLHERAALPSSSSLGSALMNTTPKKKRTRPGKTERKRKKQKSSSAQSSPQSADTDMKKEQGMGMNVLAHVKVEFPEEEDDTGRMTQFQCDSLGGGGTGIVAATDNVDKEPPSDCEAVTAASGGKTSEPLRLVPLIGGTPDAASGDSESWTVKLVQENTHVTATHSSADDGCGMPESQGHQIVNLPSLQEKQQPSERGSVSVQTPLSSLPCMKVGETSVAEATPQSLQHKYRSNLVDGDARFGQLAFMKEEADDERVYVSVQQSLSASAVMNGMREQSSPSLTLRARGIEATELHGESVKDVAAMDCGNQLAEQPQHCQQCPSQVPFFAAEETPSVVSACISGQVCGTYQSSNAVEVSEQTACASNHHSNQASKAADAAGQQKYRQKERGGAGMNRGQPNTQKNGGGPNHAKPNTQKSGGGPNHGGDRAGFPQGKGQNCDVGMNTKGKAKQGAGGRVGTRAPENHEPGAGGGFGVSSAPAKSAHEAVANDSKEFCTKLMEQLFAAIKRRERTVTLREKAVAGDMKWLVSEANKIAEEKAEAEDNMKMSLLLREEAREERRRCQSEADRLQSKLEALEKLVTEHSILLTEVNQKQSKLKIAQEELELKEKRFVDLEQLLLAREKKLAKRERMVGRLHHQLVQREKALLLKANAAESGAQDNALNCHGQLSEAGEARATPGEGGAPVIAADCVDNIEGGYTPALASRCQNAGESTNAGVRVQRIWEGFDGPKAEGIVSGDSSLLGKRFRLLEGGVTCRSAAATERQCMHYHDVEPMKVPKKEPVNDMDVSCLPEAWYGNVYEASRDGNGVIVDFAKGSTSLVPESVGGGPCRETASGLTEKVKTEVTWNDSACGGDDQIAKCIKTEYDEADVLGSGRQHQWMGNEEKEMGEEDSKEEADDLVDVPLWHIMRARKKDTEAATAIAQVQKNGIVAADERKLVVVSVEEALRKDAPELLESLTERGLILEGLELYEEGSDHGREFHELQKVLTKLWALDAVTCEVAGLPSMQVPSAVAATKAGKYCLDCLIALIEQTQYMKKRGLEVSWGWCRRLHSFLFVFLRHNRIVLERPEYGCATYFFEIAHPAPIEWQIQRLISVLAVSNVGRNALLENRPLEVGKDVTKEDADMLEGFGWAPNTGLGSLLNFCDRVVHVKGVREESKDWRKQIGEKLMAGYAQGGIPQQHAVKQEAIDEEDAAMCDAVPDC